MQSQSLKIFLGKLRYLILFSILLSNPSLAVKPYQFPKPKDLSNLKVYLLTVGLGEELYMRYGHSLLYIVNDEIKYSAAYNWGMFSFSDPEFPIKFFMGDRRYWVDQSTLAMTLRLYEHYEKRRVVQNEVFLTDLQKADLLTSINKNFKGDNVYFQYDHFYKNCTTYIRDHFDLVLGGALKQRWQKIPATQSLRDYVRINLNSPPIIGFSLDVIMNSSLDIELNSWQEAFYPLRFQELLQDMPKIDDQGEPIAGTKLLGPSETLIEANGYPSSNFHFGLLLFLIFAAPSFLSLVFVTARVRKYLGAQVRLVAFGFTGYMLFSGIYGCLMFLGLFSKVQDIQGNWNLMLFWPTDFILSFFGMVLFIFGRKIPLHGRFWNVLSVYLRLHLAFGLVWFFLALFSLTNQNMHQVLLSLFPNMVLQIIALQWLRFDSMQMSNRNAPIKTQLKHFFTWLISGNVKSKVVETSYQPSYEGS